MLESASVNQYLQNSGAFSVRLQCSASVFGTRVLLKAPVKPHYRSIEFIIEHNERVSSEFL